MIIQIYNGNSVDWSAVVKRRSTRHRNNGDSTMTDLEELRRNRPLVENLKSKDMELEKARIRILNLG
jgi:hypothetical protein